MNLKTLTGNAPVFAGVNDVTESSSGDSITVSWAPTSGPRVSYFKIFANPGTEINWSNPPVTTITTEGILSHTLTNNRTGLSDLIAAASSFDAADQIVRDRIFYGDNLEYYFGVRACTSNNVCDTNTKSLKLSGNRTKAKGAPVGPGIKTASFVRGKLVIDAPWKHQYGNVKNRRVYYRKHDGVAWSAWSESTNLTISNPHLGSVTSSITLEREEPGQNFEEFTDYEFKVIDVNEDLGSNSAYTRVVSVNSGDLTPPVFSGLASVTPGSNDGLLPETSAKFSFTASISSDIDKYEIYYTTGFGGDACNNGTLLYTAAASSFSGASNIIVGTGDPGTNPGALINLTPRTQYTFCMKAVDEAGNASGVTTYNYNSKDLTPPTFNRPNVFLAPGLNSAELDRDTKELLISWGVPNSSDVRSYMINIWQGTVNTTGLTPPDGNSANGFWIKDVEVLHPETNKAISLPMSDITENAMLYISVAACDDAGVSSPAYNSTNNCSQASLTDPWSDTDAYPFYIGDLAPPASFGGITGADLFIDKDLNGSADVDELDHGGTATVRWTLPGDISDYHQLEVFHLDQAFNRVKLASSVTGKVINCSDVNGTWTCPTSTVIKGLDQFRRYRFHVVARDASGNPTEDEDNTYYPTDIAATTKTLDTVNPKFPNNENGTEDSKFKFQQITADNIVFEWQAATDNQYDSSAKIYYELYRKQGSSFNQSGLAGATKVLDLPNTFLHSEAKASLNQGDTYYYLACARDESSNRTCPGTSVAYTVPDTTAPVLNLVKARNTSDNSDKTSEDKQWIITWNLSDNSSLSKTKVLVFYKRSEVSESSSRFTLTEGQILGVFNAVYDGTALPSLPSGVNYIISTPGSTPCSSIPGGSSDSTSSEHRLNCVLGPTDNIFGKEEWFSYFVVARDSDGLGNISTSTLSDFTSSNATTTTHSDNRVIVSSVTPEYISNEGNSKIIIQGKDFGNDLSVSLKNNGGTPTSIPCTNISKISSNMISCDIGDYSSTPISALDYFVVVSNPDGSRNQDGVVTKIRLPSDSNVSRCASAADGAASPFHYGDGTSGNPFIICSPEQMVSLMADSSLWTGKNFKVGDHLDFTSIDQATIQPIGQIYNATCVGGISVSFDGTFDGAGFLVSNFTKNFSSGVGCRLGIFGSLATGATIKNIVFQNLTLRQRAMDTTGGSKYLGIIGWISGVAATISNIQVYDSLVESDDNGVQNMGTLAAYVATSGTILTVDNIIIEDVVLNSKANNIPTGGVFGQISATHVASSVKNVKIKNVTIDAATSTAGASAALFAEQIAGVTSINFVKIENSSVTCGVADRCGAFTSYISSAGAGNTKAEYIKIKDVTITSTGSTGGDTGILTGYGVGSAINSVSFSDIDIESATITYAGAAGIAIGNIVNGSQNNSGGGFLVTRLKAKNFSAFAKDQVGGFIGRVGGNNGPRFILNNSSIIGGTLETFGTTIGDCVVGGFIGEHDAISAHTNYTKHIEINNSLVDLTLKANVSVPGAYIGRLVDLNTFYGGAEGGGIFLEKNLSITQTPNQSVTVDGLAGTLGSVTSQLQNASVFTSNYWNETTTLDASTTKTFGDITLDFNHFEGKTTTELQDQSNASTNFVGWDFTNNWQWDSEQSLYPVPRMINPVPPQQGDYPLWW